MTLFQTIELSLQLWWRFESVSGKAVCPCDETFMKQSISANVSILGRAMNWIFNKTIEFFMKLTWNWDDAIFTWF